MGMPIAQHHGINRLSQNMQKLNTCSVFGIVKPQFSVIGSQRVRILTSK